MLYRISARRSWRKYAYGFREWDPQVGAFLHRVDFDADVVVVGTGEELSMDDFRTTPAADTKVVRVLHPEHGLLWVYREDLAIISKK
jgi:hypothetical protein